MLKTASIYKWFNRRGAKFNWCRINDLFKPYKPSEGNIKRKSANFKNWYFYLHKDINECNKVSQSRSNKELSTEGELKNILNSLGILLISGICFIKLISLWKTLLHSLISLCK